MSKDRPSMPIELAEGFCIVKNQNAFKRALRYAEPGFKSYRLTLHNIEYPCIVTIEVNFDGNMIDCYGLRGPFLDKIKEIVHGQKT